MFCEESLGEINGKDVKIFQNGWVHEFYCLKALIALEQVNTLEVGQKKEKSGSIPPCSQKQVAPKYRDVRFNVTDSPPPPPSHQESWSSAILLMFVKLYQPYND